MLSNSCETSPATAAVTEAPAGAASIGGLLDRELTFPAGLLGFPDCQRFTLARFDAGLDTPSPFLVLSCRDRELSFVTIAAELVLHDYSLAISRELLDGLGAASERQIIPLLMVTVRPRVEEITVNLQGPLAIGAESAIGAQLVLEGYPLRYPLIAK